MWPGTGPGDRAEPNVFSNADWSRKGRPKAPVEPPPPESWGELGSLSPGPPAAFCSELFPAPPTSVFEAKMRGGADRKHALFARPLFFTADSGLALPMAEAVRRHGRVEVDVRVNSETQVAEYGFTMPHAFALPLEAALANVSAAPPGPERPLIFTWDRPELHEALLGGLDAAGESKRRLDTLRELSTLRPVVSIGPAGHGIAMHYHDEAWLLVLTGRKRWLLIDPHGAASQVRATLSGHAIA